MLFKFRIISLSLREVFMDQEAYEKGHHENIIVCFLLFPGEMVACMKFISSNINDSLFTVSQTDSIEECSYRGFQTRYIKRRNLYIFFQILGWKSTKNNMKISYVLQSLSLGKISFWKSEYES